MKTRSGLVAALLLAGSLLLACPGPTFVVQQYKGPQRSSASIAVLRMNGSDEARLSYLDDEDVAAPLDRDSRLHIEILPGRHTLVVANAHERSPILAFEAQAGKVYRASFGPDGVARVFEVDRSSDKLGADATVPFVVEPAAAVRPPRGAPEVPEDGGADGG